MSNGRRHFTAEQKAAIVRRHLSGKELADEFGVQPSQIHLWVKQVLEVAERAFERSSGQRKGEGAKDCKIGHLKAKIVQKNEVIVELMQENVRAKKPMGNSERMLSSPRRAQRSCRLRESLDGPRRSAHLSVTRLAGTRREQVPRLKTPLRTSQRSQCPSAAGLVIGRLGETSHPRLPRQTSPQRLSAADVHDA